MSKNEEAFRRMEEEADARDARARWNPWAEDRFFQTGWSKLRFSLFGELRIFYWIFWAGVLSQLLLYGSILWVILHFIRKYW
jgi:hypothetical protein